VRRPRDASAFARALAWGLRGWLLGLPAGVGKATARSCIKLWLGWPASRSGVWSAGNGPAMRSAVLGVCLGDDPERLRAFVRASTRLTHTDPRAERGALLIALAAHHGATHAAAGVNAAAFLAGARAALPDRDAKLAGLLDAIERHLAAGSTPGDMARALKLERGVSGYVYHTVPAVLFCWLRSPGDFRGVVADVVGLGGDADTTGAIAGAVAGATVGASGIPAEWLDGLLEWPRSVRWMRGLAGRLAQAFPGAGVAGASSGPAPLFLPGLLPRNLLFLGVVLAHGLRRLLPPW
jgi:ADP-ribosylglycohydrolase